jgi:ribosomal protein S18 acetylase RimI-like enzyme
MPHGSHTPLASAMFWRLEPLASSWGISAVGLLHMEVEPAMRRQGLATFLLTEAFRQLRSEGVSLVEVQTMQHNVAALALYQSLGFVEVDRGSVMRK